MSVVNTVSKMSVDCDTFTVYVQLFVLPVSTYNVLFFTLRSEDQTLLLKSTQTQAKNA